MRSSLFDRLERFAAPTDRQRIAWLTERPFAHRGLHGGLAAENSRSAFESAIAAGHGIELDARLSRDGYAMVFHDAELARMTGSGGRVDARTAAQLGALSLAGGYDSIETLPSILGLIAGRVPLLIEVKTDGDTHVAARLSLSVRHALEGYRGHAAVMSFDAAVCRWFAGHDARIVRGMVVSEEGERRRAAIARHLSLRRARPHFLAYDIRSLPSRRVRAARRAGLPVLTWTVRSPDDRELAGSHADQIIFERA